MPSPARLKGAFILLALSAAAPACLAEDEEFAPGRVYVVETGEGGVFTSEISDSDEDSLYFVDGSAISRGEVATVRRPGAWAEERSIHPGPETEPKGSTVKAGSSVFVALVESLVSLLIAILQ